MGTFNNELQMNKPAPKSNNNRRCAVGCVEAQQDDTYVALDRGLRNSEFGGNLLVALATDKQAEHFAFARPEF
jgi:hypothetical protein